MLFREPRAASVREAAATSDAPLPRIVVSSRVRLARNVSGERFPDWASPQERQRLLQRVGAAALQAVGEPHAKLIAIGEADERMLEVMVERWLISRDLAARGAGGGVVVAGSGIVSVMINEEDHIRIQAISPGLDLAGAWEAADAVDTRLDGLLTYAFSQRLGYLTACPSNIGTGMRASVMVHLPGLRLTGEIDPLIRGLERLRFTVRGIGGEGSEAAGHRFQISNQGTLGLDEGSVIAALERVVREVARHEALARKRALRDMPTVLEDCLARSLALLQHARLMQAEEALDYLSALRMGVEMGLIRGARTDALDLLELAVQPGHLQDFVNAELNAEMRDVRRAETLNDILYNWEVDERRVQAAAKRLTRNRERTT